MATKIPGSWNVELDGKPDFDRAIERIYAWFDQAIIDRPPIRFSMHNAEYSQNVATAGRSWTSLEDRWFDAEFQVESFVKSIRGTPFLAETFPVFWPNLGPGVYAAFHGTRLIFGEVTSWTVPQVRSWSDIASIRFDTASPCYRKIDELTALALERCPGQFLVGYTDLHGGLDCVADWRDPQQLCLDTIDDQNGSKSSSGWRRLISWRSTTITTLSSRRTGNPRSRGWASRRSAGCTSRAATSPPWYRPGSSKSSTCPRFARRCAP